VRLPTLGLLLIPLVLQPSPASAQPLSSASPVLAADIQGGRFAGDPSQLTWSPDNSALCLQTLEGDRAPLKTRHYLIRLAEHDFHGVDVAPDWAAKYWQWKTTRTPPGRPELVIQVYAETVANGIPTQSLLEKSKNGMMSNAVAAQNEAASVVRTLTLKGEAIGRYVDQPLVPGMTFGWSPAALDAVAFARPDGRLALMDLAGGTSDVDGAKDILLPAWSPDGSTVVYLQKKGRHHYALMRVAIARP
jgi:hypothetical protein